MKAIAVQIFVFCFVILVILFSCTSKKDCSQLKNGQFFYKDRFSTGHSIIKRDDSVQIVVSIANGKKDTERIKWLEPCVYELEPISRITDSAGNAIRPMKVSILNITKKYYTISVYSESEKSAFSDTIWIIKLGTK